MSDLMGQVVVHYCLEREYPENRYNGSAILHEIQTPGVLQTVIIFIHQKMQVNL